VVADQSQHSVTERRGGTEFTTAEDDRGRGQTVVKAILREPSNLPRRLTIPIKKGSPAHLQRERRSMQSLLRGLRGKGRKKGAVGGAMRGKGRNRHASLFHPWLRETRAGAPHLGRTEDGREKKSEVESRWRFTWETNRRLAVRPEGGEGAHTGEKQVSFAPIGPKRTGFAGTEEFHLRKGSGRQARAKVG